MPFDTPIDCTCLRMVHGTSCSPLQVTSLLTCTLMDCAEVANAGLLATTHVHLRRLHQLWYLVTGLVTAKPEPIHLARLLLLVHVCCDIFPACFGCYRCGPGVSLGASSQCSWTGRPGLCQMPLMLPRLHVVPSTIWLLPGVHHWRYSVTIRTQKLAEVACSGTYCFSHGLQFVLTTGSCLRQMFSFPRMHNPRHVVNMLLARP